MNLELYVVIDSRFSLGRDPIQVANSAIEGGATAIQLREAKLSTRDMVEMTERLRDLTQKAGVVFIINDRVDIALACQADGVHLGQDDLPLRHARRLMGEDKIIGLSTHSLSQAMRGAENGASYISLGPVFATKSKADLPPPVGLDLIRDVKRTISIPLVAIGGISAKNVNKVMEAGADGVAVISAIFGAPDIRQATRTLCDKIREARRIEE